jgi:hypothetical protein
MPGAGALSDCTGPAIASAVMGSGVRLVDAAVIGTTPTSNVTTAADVRAHRTIRLSAGGRLNDGSHAPVVALAPIWAGALATAGTRVHAR